MAQLTKGVGATIEANGTTLYYELRGTGPSVLFISGSTGDAGHFASVADALADEFTVITYDRRGNSRSPRPAGWAATTAEEQAADAAALLRSLGQSPAAVFGTSGGAIIGLALVVNHPEVVRGAILHEPPLLAVLPNAGELIVAAQTVIEQAIKTGGPRAGVEAFLRTLPRVDVEALPPVLR
jgi:pimeloyl-ACP methyl ester carboxylesterase